MSETAISVAGLGKKYRRSATGTAAYTTLRESLSSMMRAPFAAFAESSEKPGASVEFWALRDVSFDVNAGDVLGIIGHNGAGKSTLLKVLSRITGPTKGRAELQGRVASLLEVGTGFNRELTGRENVFLNGGILGMRRREIREKLDEIVAFAEVEDFIDTPVKHYSTGMQVRLAFSVAATLNSDILIVDEVLAVGDARFQRRCLGRMQEISGSQGRTVLFVSHNMSAIRLLCPRTLWLDHGEMHQLGSTADVIPNYLHTSLEVDRGTGDLDGVQRNVPSHGDRVRILAASINNGGPVLHGEPLTVDIDYRVTSEVPDVEFGMSFSSADGIRVLTLDSDLETSARDLSQTSRARVTVTTPELPMEIGVYSLELWATSGGNALDYLPSCAWINVVPGPRTTSAAMRTGGGVRLPAEWNWDK